MRMPDFVKVGVAVERSAFGAVTKISTPAAVGLRLTKRSRVADEAMVGLSS